MELAAISAIEGRTGEALDWLERGYRAGWKDARLLGLDPFFASLRREPRLLALTAGTILGGIVGAILSVPLTAVAWTAWKIIMEPDEEEPEPPASSPVEPVKRAARGLTAKLTGRPSASSAS